MTTSVIPAYFSTERFADVWDRIGHLLSLHKDEVAHYPDIALEPDLEIYRKMDALGLLRIFTARIGGVGHVDKCHHKDRKPGDPQCRCVCNCVVTNSTIIGYAAFFVKGALHYKSSLQAQQDVLFIHKAHRGFGHKFVAWCDGELRKEGVQVVTHHMKARRDLNFGPMLKRLGYELVDEVWAKRLDK